MPGIARLLSQALALIIGIVVHESAHALAAHLLGDATAQKKGRISLNPLNHIDPFGTVLLPLLLLAAGGPIFAFAKPVPIYLANLKHPKRDEVLVALAGPASNILLSLVFAGLLGTVLAGSEHVSIAVLNWMVGFCISSVVINLSLAFFNLIPLPPLDGSSIITPLLPESALPQWYTIQRYSMPILIALLYLVPSVLHIDLIGIYFDHTVYPLAEFILHGATMLGIR
ncbi:site-2 protease family protein [Collinsella sp. AGMB00827]|uniref:Site-2 protease family protein n=1 Tax=Collinsella ureilytica TaxID=2869515 RepID=A0ABS7MKY2_9ACTN|nr:site-2 protease family protein [Collinsella urealyticum]